jgi:spore coat-associated protein N
MLSRLQVLTSQPKLALGALLTLLLAATAVVGSGADFNATSANPANTFASGTLTIGNSKQGVAVLSASNLRPGEAAQTGDVDIENTGSLSGTFTLSKGTVSNTDTSNPLVDNTGNPLADKLNLVVVDCGTFSGSTPPTCGDGDDAQKYSGTIAAMATSNLGTYAAGAKHRYRFSVALDGTAGNAYQGDTSTVAFDFNAA